MLKSRKPPPWSTCLCRMCKIKVNVLYPSQRDTFVRLRVYERRDYARVYDTPRIMDTKRIKNFYLCMSCYHLFLKELFRKLSDDELPLYINYRMMHKWWDISSGYKSRLENVKILSNMEGN